jgi:hypothetical protein
MIKTSETSASSSQILKRASPRDRTDFLAARSICHRVLEFVHWVIEDASCAVSPVRVASPLFMDDPVWGDLIVSVTSPICIEFLPAIPALFRLDTFHHHDGSHEDDNDVQDHRLVPIQTSLVVYTSQCKR